VYNELPLSSLLGAAVLPQLTTLFLAIGLVGPEIYQIVVLAALTILVGSLGSAVVTKTHSLLALSGVSSLGVGLTALGLSSYGLLMFNLVYSLALIAIGTSLTILASLFSNLSMLRGASDAATPVGISLVILLMSLGGVPPSLGFFAKTNLMIEGSGQGLTLAIIACLIGGLPGMIAYLRLALTILTPDWNNYQPKQGLSSSLVQKEILSYIIILILGALALDCTPQILFGLRVVIRLISPGLPILLLLVGVLASSPSNNPTKGIPYECGFIALEGQVWKPFLVSFFVVGLLFLLFDLELLWVFPMALSPSTATSAGQTFLLLFFNFVIASLAYEILVGATKQV
jgi:NADH:ubiquinone oxidoreductase subunit 3 (subunit A)